MDAAFFVGLIVLVVILVVSPGPTKLDDSETSVKTEEVVEVDRD